MGKNISRKMRIATWSLQNQEYKMNYHPTDYTDIARIGFAPKIVENQGKFILETKIRS